MEQTETQTAEAESDRDRRRKCDEIQRPYFRREHAKFVVSILDQGIVVKLSNAPQSENQNGETDPNDQRQSPFPSTGAILSILHRQRGHVVVQLPHKTSHLNPEPSHVTESRQQRVMNDDGEHFARDPEASERGGAAKRREKQRFPDGDSQLTAFGLGSGSLDANDMVYDQDEKADRSDAAS